jgi:subtilisin family serine protease
MLTLSTPVLKLHKTNFNGRAIWGSNFVSGEGDYDCNGHGTHVAGTIGSTTYGVAKNSTLIAVKVLGCSGSGTIAGVIQGVNYAQSSFQSRKRPAVANMSLSGGKSTALATAVKNAISAGLQFAVAAGNSDLDACTISPADVAEAVTVGATTLNQVKGSQVDTRAYFSNFGTCVDVFAPGDLILSTWIGPLLNETLSISGTSMASPHVAGVMALYLGANPNASPAQLQAFVVQQADVDLLDLACDPIEVKCQNSPNLILHSPCSA